MLLSPDQLPFPPLLSPEAKTKAARRLIEHLQKTIEPYERIYLTPDERSSFQATFFNKPRFARFQAWLRILSEQGSIPASWKLGQIQLEEAVITMEKLYRALLNLATETPLDAEIYEQYLERPFAPNEFRLNKEDIPTWTQLPSEQVLQTSFALDWIWDQYKPGRKLEEFVPIEQDLLDVGYAADDSDQRQAFLDSTYIAHLPETLPPARIFEISELIKDKKKRYPDLSYLTTKELLEAFDAAGVRPATLIELLAYAKNNWKPKLDPKNPLTPREVAQRANVPYVYALGSIWSYSRDDRGVPCLYLRGDERQLDTTNFGNNWDGDSRFLVFRKEPL